MEIETVLIKIEPEDEIIHAAGLTDFDHDSLQNFVKTEVKLQEYSPTNANNDEINKCTTSFDCKNEPTDPFNKEKSAIKPELEIEDIFDEEDLVDLSKLKQLLNQNKSMPEVGNIKQEDKEFDENSFIEEESNIKKEEEEYDTHEDSLQLSESYDFASEDSVQECSENIDANKDHGLVKTTAPKSNIHNCKICSYQTKVKSNLTKHFNRMHNALYSNIKSCQFCDKSFTAKRTLDEHLLQQHIKEIKNDIKGFITNTILMCNVCLYKTTIKENLNKHINLTHNRPEMKHACQFCGRSFATKSTLDNHLLKQHRNQIESDIKDLITSKIHTCNICNFNTTRINHLNKHINTVHNNDRVKKNCKFCDKSFAFKYSLEDHLLKQHTNEIKGDIKCFITNNVLKCNICDFKTILKNRLNRHIDLTHSKQRMKLRCQVCDTSFACQTSLDDHVLKQHKDKIDTIKSKIHCCEICSYQTTYKSRFDKHVNFKHNEQRLKINCQFCDKSFAMKFSLDDHMIKHHKDEVENDMKDLITNTIHTCDVCDYKTTRKNHLNKHINSMHNEQRIKNKCQFCDSLFAFTYSLDNHLLKQHKEEIKDNMKYFITSKIHICDLCGYETTRKNHLTKHINSMHIK